MPCFVMADMRGISRSVTDKDILEYLEQMNKAAGRVCWEVEETNVRHDRLFRKPTWSKIYTLYYGTERGEWQVITCTQGERQRVICYMIGALGGV